MVFATFLLQCKFSPKRKALYVAKTIRNAAIAGQNNFGLNYNRLYVAEARVGKVIVLSIELPFTY